MARPSKQSSEHYVANADFSKAVVEYTILVRAARDLKKDEPRITNYIGECFMRISKGLSRRPNFANYSYRDEMMMDGVENCVRAIMNFDPNVATRTGSVNAFSYFTQICYFAFLRRLEREKKQQRIKDALIDSANINEFATTDDDHQVAQNQGIVDGVRAKRSNDKSTATSADYNDWNRVTVKAGAIKKNKPSADEGLYSL
jgi:hypothetical protein